jgi:hypothetical protein
MREREREEKFMYFSSKPSWEQITWETKKDNIKNVS